MYVCMMFFFRDNKMLIELYACIQTVIHTSCYYLYNYCNELTYRPYIMYMHTYHVYICMYIRAILADLDRKSSATSSSHKISHLPSPSHTTNDTKTDVSRGGGSRSDARGDSKHDSSGPDNNTISNPMRRQTRRLSVRENILEEKINQHKKSSVTSTPEVMMMYADSVKMII